MVVVGGGACVVVVVDVVVVALYKASFLIGDNPWEISKSINQMYKINETFFFSSSIGSYRNQYFADALQFTSDTK